MRRRSVMHLWVPIGLLVMSLLLPSIAYAERMPTLDAKEVRALIEEFGPVIVFHPDEQYFMDTPEAVLDGPSQLASGIVRNENDYDSFELTLLDSRETSSDTLLDDVATAQLDHNATDPAFRYWLDLDESLRSGHLRRAKAYVRVRLESATQLDLQFWFFYPYNGPGKAHARIPGLLSQYFYPETVGRHSGDWEHVTLRLELQTDTQDWTLAAVYLSRHTGGEWVEVSSNRLQFAPGSSHPVIYAAKDSHAHYVSAGEHAYQRLLTRNLGFATMMVDLVDFTGRGAIFPAYQPGSYRLVSSAAPGVKVAEPPAWLSFDGRWGAYEPLSHTDTISLFGQTQQVTYEEVGKGPIGPAYKPAWELGD